MYISKITLNNFRCFKGNHVLEFNEGINFFVGDNNSGKTTIFKAIEFIQSGKNKITLDLSALEIGIYFCKINSNKISQTIKLIKN